tara:strand:+ start:6093 stop:8762 length:2670 start_codon:yes stop_codon:yes gene_type:complete
MKGYLTFIFLYFSIFGYSQNLSTLGPYLKDDNSNNVILRGINLGGWMLQEPYLFQFTGAADSQHEFKEKLVEFIGQENTDNFYNSWYENFITQADVDSLASYGFNSIRLPIHYDLFTLPIQDEPVQGENTWIDLGFLMVDNLLNWCESNNMYLILDLHAAPGGQGFGSDINDYNPNLPSLWESEENKNKTIALWGKLAERYNGEPWIGGYDLLNETHWDLGENELRNFYMDVTDEIREYDQNHIIFIEGNSYANDFSGLTPPWDDEIVYSFHKYWSYNDSLDWVTWIRDQYSVPLWMGEGGENSNQWFTEAIKMFEDNYIGWAFWPWKKLESISAPYAIPSNSNYESLINYFRGDSGAPSVENAVSGLMQLAEDSHISNNIFQKDVVDAMIRQINSNETLPFNESNNNIPGILYASDYDLGPMGYAYSDDDYATYHINTDNFQAWNQGWQYRNDGVDIENSNDSEGNGYQVGFTYEDEWLLFTVEIQESGFYNVVTRYASTATGIFSMELDGIPIVDNIILYNTGSYSNFVNKLSQGIYMPQGTYKLKMKMITGGYNLSSVTFDLSDEIPEFSIEYAEAQEDLSTIFLLLNQPLNIDQGIDYSHFDVFINSEEVSISDIEISEENPQVIYISLDEEFNFQDDITVSFYQESELESVFNEYLLTFSEFPVYNNVSERILIPGYVEAEDFIFQEGLSTEDTSDSNGGLNIGYTDVGDYADYLVLVTESGEYDINFRVASENQSGSILLQLIDGSNIQNLTQISLPITGGWQTWQTVSASTTLNTGSYKLRMKVIQAGFNLNWIEFDYTGNSMGLNENKTANILLYPNPTSEILNISTNLDNFKIEIFDLIGKKIFETINSKSLHINEFDNGIYLLKISHGMYSQSKLFIKK